FSWIKGVKGIPLRIHIETKTENGATSNTIEKAFAKVKLFRDKHTRACLASNKFCGAIVNEHTVFCMCGQKVILDNDYDESRLNEHSNNSRCKVNNKKRQLGLPGLFPVLPNPPKKKKNSPSSSPLPTLSLSSSSPLPTLSSLSSSSPLPTLLSPSLYPNKPCSGLRSEQIRSYINRTPSTYGGARWRDIIEKEMFQDKFSNQMKFNSKKLNEEEVLQFNQQIITKSKWFIDRFGPVVAMTDCTKVKAGLQFSSSLGCIVGSTLNQNDCIIKTYEDIYNKVSNIKQENAIAKYVRVYVLQVPLPKFPPVIVALISTRNEDGEKIFALHQMLIEIAANLELHIISIGSDGAAAEFQAQHLLQATKTKYRVQHRNLQFAWKKTARNAAMSGARLLTFGHSTVHFDHLLELSLKKNSVMYKRDVIKLDRQDDNAAYRVFCSSNLAQVLDNEEALLPELQGELIDSYLNRHITHQERIHRDYYENIPLLPWKHGTESCEHIFEVAHQFRSDFTFLEILQMEIPIYLHILLFIDLKLILGYDFNKCEEITLLDNNLECLRYWPSNIEIDDTIDTSYKRAIHLARHLEMTSIPDDVYYFNIHKKYPTSQLEDFWNDDSDLETADNNDHIEDNTNSSHIVYYLASKDISIDEEVLILKGQAKQMFNAFKK
ncbi:5235_t:CDS:2, partial [Gigaspora rosea]